MQLRQQACVLASQVLVFEAFYIFMKYLLHIHCSCGGGFDYGAVLLIDGSSCSQVYCTWCLCTGEVNLTSLRTGCGSES